MASPKNVIGTRRQPEPRIWCSREEGNDDRATFIGLIFDKGNLKRLNKSSLPEPAQYMDTTVVYLSQITNHGVVFRTPFSQQTKENTIPRRVFLAPACSTQWCL